MIEHCVNCRGTKKLLGLGNISKECNYCNGVGYIESKEDEDEILTHLPVEESQDISLKITQRKKPGRKKQLPELHL